MLRLRDADGLSSGGARRAKQTHRQTKVKTQLENRSPLCQYTLALLGTASNVSLLHSKSIFLSTKKEVQKKDKEVKLKETTNYA